MEEDIHSILTRVFANTKKVTKYTPKRWYTLVDGLQQLNINMVDVRMSVEDLQKIQEFLEKGK